MPRNTRNVWLSASIDGRGSMLEGGPVSRDGGMSATILQREDGGISDHALRVASLTTRNGTIVTEARVTSNGNAYGRPSIVLHTHRDEPGAVVTLDVPGLTEVVPTPMAVSMGYGDTSATLRFRGTEERDAFLSTLAVWRAAQESAEVSA